MKLYLLAPILLILLSCNSPSSQTTRATDIDSIPEGAVSFEYDFNLKRAILIPGTLNDSVPLWYFLETGFLKMTFSDSLTSDFEKKEDKNGFRKIEKTMEVRIGGFERIYGDSVDAYCFDKNDMLFRWRGTGGILPWQFFDQKIIEISFSKQYIRELSGTRDLTGYDSVKMEVENGFLGIPVAVSVQGKKIKAVVTIDTGCNGDISFSNNIIFKYGIKSDNAFFGKAHLLHGFNSAFSFKSDTVQVGKFILTQNNYVSFSLDRQRPYPFSGLLGNGILEKFDLVLDLRNYYLYLKPTPKSLLQPDIKQKTPTQVHV
ncbi:MAG TPA: hypothetical protein VI413_12920 [Paludibacter sp.]